MESDKVSESAMNEIVAVRILFPKHTSKRLAQIMDVPIGTAREWLYERMSSARRRELAEALKVECQRRHEQVSSIESAIELWLARKASEL